MVKNVETIARTSEQPWAQIGRMVNPRSSPQQVLKEAGLDWSVDKVPAFIQVGNDQIEIPRSALVRSSDKHILSVVTNDWNPLQNDEAFEFFNDFIKAGKMEMFAAGSLKKGELVWALAKVNESFTIGDDDEVQSFLLFTNPHRFGKSIDIRFVPMRMASMCSLSMALTHETITQARVSHRVEFDPLAVKDTLAIAHEKMELYRQAAELLAAKKMAPEQTIEYYKQCFPVLTQKDNPRRDISRLARIAVEIQDSMSGADLAKGTLWGAFNTVCYVIDHLAGRNDDNRLEAAWFGTGKDVKSRAIDIALEMVR